MTGQMFRELATATAKTQGGMIDNLLDEAPALAALPMNASSHGLYNVYEELIGADGAGAVDLDEALPEVASESKLKQVDLKVLGAIMTVGEDKAKAFGGPAAYFGQHYGPVLKKTGSDMEKALLYNTFRSSAIANNTAGDPRVVSAGGSTAGKQFSIIAVHYSEGEVTGLYDPAGFGNGKVFDVNPINNGAIYLDKNGRLVYGVRLKSYFGVQVANRRYVSALVNVEPDKAVNSGGLTAGLLDGLIENCRGRPENTVIYMHPHVLTALYELKGGLLKLSPSDQVNRMVETWNGVQIVTTYNMLRGSEAVVSL